MDFRIRDSYKIYITVQMIRDFVGEKKLKIKSGINKEDLIFAIEEAVYKNEISTDEINEWINEILEAGPKHIYFVEASLGENSMLQNIVERNGFFNMIDIKEEFTEVYCRKESEIINLGIGIKLYKENEVSRSASTFYMPINIKYNTKRGDLLITYSSHKDLYFTINLESDKKVTESKFLYRLLSYINDNYGLQIISKYKDILRKSIYRILEENSGLPESIEKILNDVDKTNTDFFLKTLKSTYEIKDGFQTSMEEDLLNFIEKYVCLSWDNQDDFTRNKKCYPFNISLKDRENTTLIQKSDLNSSLLTKSAYHDNKKTLKKEQMCESIHMAHDDGNRKYKVVYSVVNNIGKIAYEKYLNKEAMNELIDNLIFKYYDEKSKII